MNNPNLMQNNKTKKANINQSEIIKLKNEIKNLKKQIEILEKRVNTYENTNFTNNNISKNLNGTNKKSKETIGIDDQILYEFPLDEYFEKSLKKLNSLYEYNNNLSEEKNILRKIILKEYGRQLTYDKNFSEAIDFYKNLMENSYFKNDWYPYRQLTIVYDKTKDYENNLLNIKNLFLSGVYLNKYQYVWFTNKIKSIMENIEVNENEVQKWLEYYDLNGSKNSSRLNRFLADQFTKSENMIKVIDRKSFDFRQEIYGLQEIGMINERVGNYELAIVHYKNIIDENKYNIYKFYQRICLCLEKMEDYSREYEAIKLYYTHPPKQTTKNSDEWFEKRLKIVNKKLGTNYKTDNFKI